jgi:elongin-A
MPAPSLVAMAQNAAIRNITSITDIADLPYRAVAPILSRIDNPQQLRDVEVACPHIAESSGPLWQAFIKRDVSNAESKMCYPKDPKNWWKVYKKMVKQEAADKAAAEEALRAAMNGLKDAKSGKETTYVPKVFALGQKKTSGFFDGVRQGGNSGGGGGWGGKAPMLWNAKNGRDAFGAMQRATASKVKIFKPGPNARHYVPDGKSQIREAPKSMIQDNSGQAAVLRAAAEAKKYAEPTSTRPQSFAPMAATSKAEQAFRNEEIKAQLERERRLRSLTASTARPAMHAAPQTQSRSTTTAATTNASSSQRTSSSTTSTAPPKRHASLSPSPPTTTTTTSSSIAPKSSQSSQPLKPTVLKRKRPAAAPFLSSKRR